MTNYDRTRARSTLVKPTLIQKNLLQNGGFGATTSYEGNYQGESEEVKDCITPHFKKLRAEGKIIINPFSSVRVTRTTIGKTSSWRWPYNAYFAPTTVIGFEHSDPIAVRFAPQSSDNGQTPGALDGAGFAITEAFSRVDPPDALTLVTMGEFHQTLAMITGPLRMLQKKSVPFERLKMRFRRGQLNANDYSQELAGLWLTYRYGILPLIYDIEGHLKAFQDKNLEPLRKTARGKFKDSGKYTDLVNTSGSSMISSITLTDKVSWTRECRAGVIYEPSRSLENALGLTLANLPTAIWELTRLSFVADWFFNTGDYLAALTAKHRANILGAYVSDKTVLERVSYYSESGGKVHPNTGATCLCLVNGTGAQTISTVTKKLRWQVTSAMKDATWGNVVSLSNPRIADGFALVATSLFGGSKSKARRL